MLRGVAGRCGLSGLAVHNRSASPGPPLCIPVALLWPSSQSRQEAIEAWLPHVITVREKIKGHVTLVPVSIRSLMLSFTRRGSSSLVAERRACNRKVQGSILCSS